MKTAKKGVLFLSLCASLFVLLPVHAQTLITPTLSVATTATEEASKSIIVNQSELGFRIPTFSEVLTFVIRGFFVFAGLAALIFLLLGAFAWITSGGDKDKVSAAQQKIQAAVLGLIMIVIVLSLVITLEQVVFGGKLCFGLSCPITIPTLLRDPNSLPNSSGQLQLIDVTPTPNPSQTPATSPAVSPSGLETATPLPQDVSHPYPNVPDTGRGE